MNVLITGAGALLGQGIIRTLRASSLEVTIAAVDPNPLSAGLYWADRSYIVPMADDPTYLAAIEDILERERPDVVLIGTDVELPFFAAHRHRLESIFHTHFLVSDPHVVRIAEDKWLTNRFLKDAGFNPPQSCLAGDEAKLVNAVGFPLIVKPRVGSRSMGVRVVHGWDELAKAVEEEPDCIIQECVATDADEYTAGALVFEGRCQASIVMRRILKDGNTYQAFVEDYPELNAYVRRVAEELRPHGPVNIQFRLDEGKPRVFEINARFSGTTPLRALAGFNEVEIGLDWLIYGMPVIQPKIRPMTILRHWSETVVPLRSLSDVQRAYESLPTR
ncbi:MAG: ATP-grasp domain-containing protein [Bradymonadaceae bacterium]